MGTPLGVIQGLDGACRGMYEGVVIQGLYGEVPSASPIQLWGHVGGPALWILWGRDWDV